MPRTTTVRKRRHPWSAGDISLLRRWAGRKHARTIGNMLQRRRREGAVRQKALKMGLSLDTRG